MNIKHDQCQAWEEEIARLKEANKVLRAKLALAMQIIEKLEKSNAFYADTDNWLFNEIAITKDVSEIIGRKGIRYESGGKTARQALKEVEEMKEALK